MNPISGINCFLAFQMGMHRKTFLTGTIRLPKTLHLLVYLKCCTLNFTEIPGIVRQGLLL
ncbi:MAG TPA: hypothetical protein DCY35_00725 [Prolixibacteraceae bacterium]|nr:hypothetical protein [Prolixibacteraceae bacterium]